HRSKRVQQTFVLNFRDDRFDEIRSLPCLLDEALANHLDRSPFSSRANQRSHSPHEHTPSHQRRHRNLGDKRSPRLSILQHLLHQSIRVHPRPSAAKTLSIKPLTHSARASHVPDATTAWRATAAAGSLSCNASSTRRKKSSRVRAILSTSRIGSYSGNGEMTTGFPVARYSRTLIADP